MQVITIHALSRKKKKTIIEKIKNKEKLFHTLPVSIKCGFIYNNVVKVLKDEYNACFVVENL